MSAAKSSESIYFHQFLEIQCSYLCPNDLDESFLAKENSEFVIFHNNVDSLCATDNNTIDKVKDVFQNCSGKLPDVLAFSDTRVDDNSPIPLLREYHDFQFTTTPTGAGGVGFFLKDSFDYELLPDLNLNLTGTRIKSGAATCLDHVYSNLDTGSI